MSNDTEILLGKNTEYPSHYQPELLFPVARQQKRDEIGVLAEQELPFAGSDIWNAYELSWLNQKGKPQVAIGVFEFACDSENIVESKSFKLYLNSFNQTRFEDWSEVESLLLTDLSKAANGRVKAKLYSLQDYNRRFPVSELKAKNIDQLDIEVEDYQYQADILRLQISEQENNPVISECLTSDLLKSNCLITNQPDWASVVIEYKGQPIEHQSLLKYLISFRDHNEFHEQCVERIFSDIMRLCQPQELTVYARYTRRGGLDINPIRTNSPTKKFANTRLVRQ